jgi:hypothetical protein
VLEEARGGGWAKGEGGKIYLKHNGYMKKGIYDKRDL